MPLNDINRSKPMAANTSFLGSLIEADIATDEGARAFYDALTAEERERSRAIVEHCRTKIRNIIQTAKAARSLNEKYRSLARVLVGSNELFELELSSFYDEAADGKAVRAAIACRKGCSFCCYIRVEVSIIEAFAIAAGIDHKKPHLRSVVQRIAPQTARLSIEEHASKRVPCPLLEDGACSIYEIRPLACRGYFSFDAGKCEAAFNAPSVARHAIMIPSFSVPKTVYISILAGAHQACDDEGVQSCGVELTSALNLILADKWAINRWLKGKAVFDPYESTKTTPGS